MCYIRVTFGPEPATPLTVESGNVGFEAGALADGRMHFYDAQLPTGNVRIFAIQVAGQIHTCLDACEICGPKGYFLQGGAAVCRNCTSPIPLTSLGRGGGCNPVPVAFHRAGSRVLLTSAELEAAKPLGEGR